MHIDQRVDKQPTSEIGGISAHLPAIEVERLAERASAVVPSGKLEEATANIAPAVWARGSGAWLSRDDSETVNAFGQNFRFNLNPGPRDRRLPDGA
jgi:hypothetical protein